MNPEVTFYQDRDVTVTSARAIVFNTTYALANITSVREWTVKKSKYTLALGFVLILGGIVPVLTSMPTCGVVLIGAGAICLMVYFLDHDKHVVRIGTAGGEADALHSRDLAYVRNIVAAINNAIVHRG